MSETIEVSEVKAGDLTPDMLEAVGFNCPQALLRSDRCKLADLINDLVEAKREHAAGSQTNAEVAKARRQMLIGQSRRLAGLVATRDESMANLTGQDIYDAAKLLARALDRLE